MREPVLLAGVLLLAWAGSASRTASGVEEPKYRVALAEGDRDPALRARRRRRDGRGRGLARRGQRRQDVDIDLAPDIAVGRLPCRSPREVRIIVQKIINYETSTFGQPWFSRMLVVAGDTYPVSGNPNWTGYEGEYYGDRAIENMTGFTPTRLYTSDETFADKKDVSREYHNGYGFVYFVGHGSPKQWGNNKANGTGFVQGPNSNDMWKFRNKERLPVCVVSGCHNSQFDVCLRRLFNKDTRWKQEYVL